MHLITVLAGSAICLGLLLIIALSLLDLAGPVLGRLYLKRAGLGFDLQDLTPTERRVHFARLVLDGRIARLFGVSRTLAFLGAYRLTYQPRLHSAGRSSRRGLCRGVRRGVRRTLLLARAQSLEDNGSIELFVEGPTLRRSNQPFRFGVRRRLVGRASALHFHEAAEMALLDYYESAGAKNRRDAGRGTGRGAA